MIATFCQEYSAHFEHIFQRLTHFALNFSFTQVFPGIPHYSEVTSGGIL